MDSRIKSHPILDIPSDEECITFYWEKKAFTARKGEMLASALMANGVKIFGHHHKDGTAQGIFCANGQCSKCTVIANGVPVKSCMTSIKANMFVESAEGLPKIPEIDTTITTTDIEEIETDVLIIGGGPAGLSAAIQLGKNNIKTLLIDDKNELGGKLVLQTHKFFGSQKDSNAGTRGFEIGKILTTNVKNYQSITIWKNSTALFVFSDKKVGIVKNGDYKLIKPKLVLNTAGAREKYLRFNGNTLAGIYGAGAFQTLVNRDFIKPTNRLFIIGGGNVGLIAGYHALQAGINVIGVCEALPKCGGYKVHADKLKRLGVPIYTSHSILSANGNENVESITITKIDNQFQPIKGSEKTFECDTILIAVGLESLSEFTIEAQQAGLPIVSAGDALEIAEASSAMFNGKIAGLKICKIFGDDNLNIPDEWYEKAKQLKARPGDILDYKTKDLGKGVFPIIHCLQEIPCNPCSTVCPKGAIKIDGNGLFGTPYYSKDCIGCGQCVLVCPGLAISLVDYRNDLTNPTVSLPYEITNIPVSKGDLVEVCDINANYLGKYPVVDVKSFKEKKTSIVKIKVPKNIAAKIISFKIQDDSITKPLEKPVIPEIINDGMVCLCERVTVKEVKDLIKKGIYDINFIKAITHAGMGACGGKTCEPMIRQLIKQEGIPVEAVVPGTKRPVFIEVPLGAFVNAKEVKQND